MRAPYRKNMYLWQYPSVFTQQMNISWSLCWVGCIRPHAAWSVEPPLGATSQGWKCRGRRDHNLRKGGHGQGQERQQRGRPMVSKVAIHCAAVNQSSPHTIAIQHKSTVAHILSEGDTQRWRHDGIPSATGMLCCMQSTDPGFWSWYENSPGQTYFESQTEGISLQMLTV